MTHKTNHKIYNKRDTFQRVNFDDKESEDKSPTVVH